MSAAGVIDVQCHTDSHSRVFCSGEVQDFVTPRYGATPLLNRPQLLPQPSLRFVTTEDLGAPLYVARSRMSDGRRALVSLDVHEGVLNDDLGGRTWRVQVRPRGEEALFVSG